ncbi:hypothetical protein [Saccharothrix obliqua]|uniref:hypothetical protein n=1 Tax=Saccharothrix obliqua TaxID=2861747 RepID=UPI001C5FB78C|nr:hypothetical protein [Saccharothrix obliqua]MBW4717420.1 hypothetical protein [Saccharothrix obliqua]
MTRRRKDWRKAALFAVMTGALALTVNGEVRAVAPMLGVGFGVVLALVFAVSTLLALNYVIDGSGPVRRWAWAVLLFAGGMELGLNTWHAVTSVALDDQGRPLLIDGGTVPALPLGAAVAVGAGPVLLAGLLSHLVSLAVSATAPVLVSVPAPSSQPVPVRYSAKRESGTADAGTDFSGTDHRAALTTGTAAPAGDQPAATSVQATPTEDRPTGTDQAHAEDRDPREVWGPELWDRAVRTARDYHDQHGSHVRVDDVQALGIGRNRAVALRRDVLAHLLSQPAA